MEADVSYESICGAACATRLHLPRQASRRVPQILRRSTLSVQAELATDYFTLRSRDRQQMLLDKTVADYQTALELQQRLFDGGAVPLSDLAQAQAQLETARTQAADNNLARAQTEHAIAVLIGAKSRPDIICRPIPLAADATVPPPSIRDCPPRF